MPCRAWAASFPMLPAMVALLHRDEQRSAGLNFQSGHLVDVNRKRVTQFNLCPSCGRYMQAISKSEIYECKECRVFVTQPG
jgi:tRNA(Ile2) C34 agmatinyltransferase TiaS